MKIIIIKFKDKSRLPVIAESLYHSQSYLIINHIGYLLDFGKDRIKWPKAGAIHVCIEDVESYSEPSQELLNYFLSHYKEHIEV